LNYEFYTYSGVPKYDIKTKERNGEMHLKIAFCGLGNLPVLAIIPVSL
jgi:hypothetical protein